jgi:hypothetical protein
MALWKIIAIWSIFMYCYASCFNVLQITFINDVENRSKVKYLAGETVL